MTKKILLIAAVLIMAVSQNSAFAQYAAESRSDNTHELQIGKGVHLTDAGKTLLFTGASVALTGVACFIGGSAMYNPDPKTPEMPLYPMFAIAGLATGGIIALIGLPFYCSGTNKMNKYDSSHLVFGNDTQKGGTGFFEMGLGVPNFLSLDAVGGYNLSKNLFVGAGLGYKTYLTAGLRQDGQTASVPIYTNIRYSIGKKRIVPYISASLGYDMVNTGLYTGVEFGTRLRKIEGKRGQSWWFGARSEFISPEGMALSVKIGKSF